MDLSRRLASLAALLIFALPLSAAEPAVARIPNVDLLALSQRPGFSIEVGAADSPICSPCVQVDRHASQFDLYRQSYIQEGLAPEQAEKASAAEGASKAPWAAGQRGIIADAASLPFASGSVSLIVSKNFPWFGPSSVPEKIAPILREYERVLKEGGLALLLATSPHEPREWAVHSEVAAHLGFQLQRAEVPAQKAAGLLLSKPAK